MSSSLENRRLARLAAKLPLEQLRLLMSSTSEPVMYWAMLFDVEGDSLLESESIDLGNVGATISLSWPCRSSSIIVLNSSFVIVASLLHLHLHLGDRDGRGDIRRRRAAGARVRGGVGDRGKERTERGDQGR